MWITIVSWGLLNLRAEYIGAWIPASVYDMVLELSTRAAARAFVGEPICRDETFLETSASFSRNTFNTIASFRNLGGTIGSLFGALVPSVSDAREQLVYVQQLLGSEVKRRRACPEETHDDFLGWCMELARTEEESKPEALAHRTLGILSMAVVHTTAMATTHMLFDVIANPTLRESLTKEQEEILASGWEEGISQKAMLEMRRLDSLMRESQRFNPVGECKSRACPWRVMYSSSNYRFAVTFRRVVREPISLSDGYKLQPGQQIGVLARRINMDDNTIDSAQSFDPLRWAHQQGASALFAHSSASNLHFGLGRYACPGRFFASVCMARLLSIGTLAMITIVLLTTSIGAST